MNNKLRNLKLALLFKKLSILIFIATSISYISIYIIDKNWFFDNSIRISLGFFVSILFYILYKLQTIINILMDLNKKINKNQKE